MNTQPRKILELWRFTIATDMDGFDAWLTDYFNVYTAEQKPRLIATGDEHQHYYSFALNRTSVINITVTNYQAGKIQLLLERKQPLFSVGVEHGEALARWLSDQLRSYFNLNFVGDRTTSEGATLHEFTCDAVEPQVETLEDLIAKLPGEPQTRTWWKALNDAYNDDRILERINITHERLEQITGIPERTLKRYLKKRK